LALEQLRGPAADPRPDVVLLDLNLPGFDGLATLGALKGDPRLRRIPVVILTTSKSQDEIDRCYELGAAAVLNKPLRLRDYRDMIDAFERFWLCQVRFGETG
jgi:CheY-like chemotaxis protein